MHIVLTRAAEDNAGMQARLEARGITVSLSPMLTIAFEPIDPASIEAANALIVTSRNALKSLAQSRAVAVARAKPLFAVGPATAALAKSLGFRDVIEGPGTAAALTGVIAGSSLAKSGPLLHLCGDVIAYDLQPRLCGYGLEVLRLTTYRSVAAKTLDPRVRNSLASGGVDAVILMSPATARAWRAATSEPELKARLTKVALLCLSDAVAKPFEADTGQKIEIPSAPNAEQMLALAFRLAANLEPG